MEYARISYLSNPGHSASCRFDRIVSAWLVLVQLFDLLRGPGSFRSNFHSVGSMEYGIRKAYGIKDNVGCGRVGCGRVE